ncbi:MAG: hypothetical protein ACK5QS_14835, partial [Pseudanabaenaceae cyanobacterium]
LMQSYSIPILCLRLPAPPHLNRPQPQSLLHQNLPRLRYYAPIVAAPPLMASSAKEFVWLTVVTSNNYPNNYPN